MSRIEEAFKRASAASGAESAERADTRSTPAAFEQYAAESAAPEPPLRRQLSRVAAPPLQVVPQAPPVPPVAAARLAPATAAVRIDSPVAGRLVTSSSAKAVVIEQYRRLAAALHEAQHERELKRILVTSTVPREGKTLSITNLALTLADCYHRRVLLIDADLRRPSVHEVLGLANTHGLTEGLRFDGGPLSPVAVTPCLSVLPAGQPDPNPLTSLTSDRMRRLLDEASSGYDWVLVDAPPVSVLPDAQHLARLVDGVLFVIRAGATPYALIERALNELGRERVLGTILNDAEIGSIAGEHYYEHYYDTRP